MAHFLKQSIICIWKLLKVFISVYLHLYVQDVYIKFLECCSPFQVPKQLAPPHPIKMYCLRTSLSTNHWNAKCHWIWNHITQGKLISNLMDDRVNSERVQIFQTQVVRISSRAICYMLAYQLRKHDKPPRLSFPRTTCIQHWQSWTCLKMKLFTHAYETYIYCLDKVERNRKKGRAQV